MKNFQVWEDNAGGLYLVTFDNLDRVDYLHAGFEYRQGELLECLAALSRGDDPKYDWEGNEEDAQNIYNCIEADSRGFGMVADNKGLYPFRMGSARLEFQLSEEDLQENMITWEDYELER